LVQMVFLWRERGRLYVFSLIRALVYIYIGLKRVTNNDTRLV
jgi:hypothetical protein